MWTEGDWIVRRELCHGRPWLGTVVRVVVDCPDLLVSYLPSGAPFDFPDGDWPGGRHPWEGRGTWQGHGVLMLQRPGESHAIWHFWKGPERTFAGWYVNFQRPFVRTVVGYDTSDLELDIWIRPDGTWQWKDAELLDERVAEGRFTQQEMDGVRAEGNRFAADLAFGRRWWDESWSAFEPDPDWRVPALPPDWDRIASREGVRAALAN
jgi:Protein of unknown function (DUF402)